MSSDSKEFTREELNRYNGRDQSSVYIAHDGKVYDVSGSKFWKTGLHMKRHYAGSDLTEEIKEAPHGTEVFGNVPQVGILKIEKDPMDENVPEIFLALFKKIPMLRRHPHPMTVHFPIAFAMSIPLFNVLYMITGDPCFEFTAFSILVLTILSTLVAMITGPYTWWLNYRARWTFNIKVKMCTSAILLVLLLAIFLWRVSHPNIMFIPSGARMIYFSLSLAFPFLVSILGWFGAKMTFPH